MYIGQDNQTYTRREAKMAKNSKNQRGSKPATGTYTEAGNSIKFVELGAGYCYIRDPSDGKLHHMKVSSEDFVTTVKEISEKYPMEKLLTEMRDLAKRFPNSEWKNSISKF